MTYALNIGRCNATKPVKDIFTAIVADLIGAAPDAVSGPVGIETVRAQGARIGVVLGVLAEVQEPLDREEPSSIRHGQLVAGLAIGEAPTHSAVHLLPLASLLE